MNKPKSVRELIQEMKMRLDESQFTFESFMMPEYEEENPEGYDSYEEDDEEIMVNREQNPSDEENMPMKQSKISGIEKELTDIRKIALSVIARLADQPTSEQYDLMKRIWNLVDKAMEEPTKGK